MAPEVVDEGDGGLVTRGDRELPPPLLDPSLQLLLGAQFQLDRRHLQFLLWESYSAKDLNIRICLAELLWFYNLWHRCTFFFFCRAFIASRFRRNFSLCSASLTMKIEIKKKGNKNGLSEYLKREGGYIKISVIFGLPLQLLLRVDAGHDGAGHPGDPEPALQLRLRLLLHDCNLYLLLRSPAIRSVSFMLQGAVFQI